MGKFSILYSDIRKVKKQFSLINLVKKLPLPLQKENANYLGEQDRFSHAISRLLLAELIYKFTKKDISYLSNLKYNSHQKPYFDLDFHFNISHSGNYVVCAASKTSNLGVDIEEKRILTIEHFEDLFTHSEWKEIKQDKTLNIFFDYWSKKESIIKADGRGLGIDLKSILIEQNKTILANQHYYLFPLAIDSNYSAHICTQEPKIDIELSLFNVFA
jgi:4'-phosphopantetheinyl transferase